MTALQLKYYNSFYVNKISFSTWNILQRFFALLLLILSLPLILIVSALIKLTSPGPIIYSQIRMGLNGQFFVVRKLRTMKMGADKNIENGLVVSKTCKDVTSIGKILRDLKIDELPQLWNVVLGEMDIVGPRPISIDLYKLLDKELPNFSQRLQAKPGLTNLAQISFYQNEELDNIVDDWRVRSQAELHYITNKSFFYDVIVIVMTVVFIGKKFLNKFIKTSK